MGTDQPISQRNLDGYGTPPIEWSRVSEVLDSELTQAPGTGGPGRHTTWLTTTNPDGTPHVVPLGALPVDGVWYFTSGPSTRKSKNLDRDPRCVISVATDPFDLVMEGRGERVTDRDVLERVVTVFNAGGWPARVEDDAFTAEFSAPSAGPPPWYLYRFSPRTVFAFGTAEPYGATRFDLG